MNNTRTRRSFIAAVSALALATSVLVPASSVAAEAPDKDSSQSQSQSQAPFTFQKVSFQTDPRFTQLLGINDKKVIAGYHGDENTEMTPNKGFTLTLPSNFSDENFPSSVQTQVVGINNSDDTVGFYIDQAGNTHGFEKLKSKNEFTTLDMPGTTFNQLLGNNNKGQAAGYFQDAAGLQHGYLRLRGGNYLVLNIPMPSSQATSVNDKGVIIGFEQTSPAATTASGWIIKDSKLEEFTFPGSTFTQALGINNRDDIVGTYNDAQGATHGFFLRNGHFTTVDVPGAASTVINGINNDDQIVGFFTTADGNVVNTVGLVGTPGDLDRS